MIDLSSPDAFSRLQEDDDGEFFDAYETITPADQNTQNHIRDFYHRFIHDGDKILDLMAGDKSYLPNKNNLEITGLGIKQRDLDENTCLNHRLIHNVNSKELLPFSEDYFDLVICTFAIEYMTQPLQIFAEVARILKSGGYFCIGFSNQYYEKKAIKLWRENDYKGHMNIILQYFKSTKKFTDFVCEAWQENNHLPAEKFINTQEFSSPAYMIKGTRV